MEKFNYGDITEILQRLGMPMEAAELQGTLCGLMMSQMDQSTEWLAEQIGTRDADDLQTREDVTQLTQLLGEMGRQLNGSDLQFELLLPKNQETLELRAHALATWCSGFLYGYGIAQANRQQQADPQGTEAEILRDLTDICHLQFDAETSTEEDEMNFIHVAEHVRISILLLFEENRPTAFTSQTIH